MVWKCFRKSPHLAPLPPRLPPRQPAQTGSDKQLLGRRGRRLQQSGPPLRLGGGKRLRHVTVPKIFWQVGCVHSPNSPRSGQCNLSVKSMSIQPRTGQRLPTLAGFGQSLITIDPGQTRGINEAARTRRWPQKTLSMRDRYVSLVMQSVVITNPKIARNKALLTMLTSKTSLPLRCVGYIFSSSLLLD